MSIFTELKKKAVEVVEVADGLEVLVRVMPYNEHARLQAWFIETNEKTGKPPTDEAAVLEYFKSCLVDKSHKPLCKTVADAQNLLDLICAPARENLIEAIMRLNKLGDSKKKRTNKR